MSMSYLPRLLTFETKRCSYILAAIPKFSVVQSASITSKEWREPVKKSPPWPYETRKFTLLHAYFEGTVKRFDENTKIIVVDGNIGAGKSEFAKQLADAFEMKYIPEPNLADKYITKYGYNLREIDPIVPFSYKSFLFEDFYKNPKHGLVPKMQFQMYMMRLENYIDGLAHLLNTGQGLVFDRSVYSDFVFVEAMYKHGCFRKEIRDFYFEAQQATTEELLKPHLVVYLDVSPETALERIKKRGNPIEQNSPILNKAYLESLEYFYKQHYLKEFQKHSEILVYDWNSFGDVEVIVEDIERIDFDRYTKYDTQLKDWRKEDDWEWAHYRVKYGNKKWKLMGYANIPAYHLHELYHPDEEAIEYRKILDKVPGEQYLPGFNPHMGDNVWFKMHNYRNPGVYRQ